MPISENKLQKKKDYFPPILIPHGNQSEASISIEVNLKINLSFKLPLYFSLILVKWVKNTLTTKKYCKMIYTIFLLSFCFSFPQFIVCIIEKRQWNNKIKQKSDFSNLWGFWVNKNWIFFVLILYHFIKFGLKFIYVFFNESPLVAIWY